jgi:hypothetical protein
MVDLLEMAKEAAEKIPAVMDGPTSDWVPVLLYEAGDGTFHPAAIPNLTREGIASAAEGVRQLLLSANAVQAVMTLNTMFTEMDMEGASQSERVLITYVTKGHARIEAALILRGRNVMPRLGPWDRVAEDADVGRGPFVDAMREAIG